MTKTSTRTPVASTRAVTAAGIAATVSAVTDAQTQSQQLATTVTNDGWNYGKAEALAGASANALMALHDDKLSRAFFGYGYCAAFLVARNDAPAITAAKKDNPAWTPAIVAGRVTNWPVFGPALLAYGKLVMDRGVAPDTKNVKHGYFVRSELEHAAYKASNTAWKNAIDRATDKPKAKRAPSASGSGKGKKATVTTVYKLDKLPKVSGTKEAIKLALDLALAEETLAKSAPNELPLAVKEAIAALAKATREAWELMKDA